MSPRRTRRSTGRSTTASAKSRSRSATPSEVTHITGRRPNGGIARVRHRARRAAPAANPAFDVTPARAGHGVITERGVCAASARGSGGAHFSGKVTRCARRTARPPEFSPPRLRLARGEIFVAAVQHLEDVWPERRNANLRRLTAAGRRRAPSDRPLSPSTGGGRPRPAAHGAAPPVRLFRFGAAHSRRRAMAADTSTSTPISFARKAKQGDVFARRGGDAPCARVAVDQEKRRPGFVMRQSQTLPPDFQLRGAKPQQGVPASGLAA